MNTEAILKYPVTFLSAFLVSLFATKIWRNLGPRLGFVDYPGERKIHRSPIPSGGGIAIYLGLHFACGVILLGPWQPFAGQITTDWWVRFLVLSTMIVSLGLADDHFGVKPSIKLGGQVLISLAAYLLGIRIQNVLGFPLQGWADLIFTMGWFLLLVNSFNLIDGLDGLSAGIAAIAGMGIALSLVFRRLPGDVLLFLAFVGACLGFLRYNFFPASIFLGDTGSMLLGFTLAAFSLSTSSKGFLIAGIGIPLLGMGLPVFDTLLAIWRRSIRYFLNRGQGAVRPMLEKGDADHLHHRLLRKGLQHKQVTLVFYGMTCFLAVSGLFSFLFNDRSLGILGVTFLLASYMAFRHLAWIEVRETGQVFLRGIVKPERRNRTMIRFMLADIAILNLALLVSLFLMEMQGNISIGSMKSLWFRQVAWDVSIPFLFLMLFKSYNRVWYLAWVSEYATPWIAFILGAASAACFNLILFPKIWGIEAVILKYVLYTGIAGPALIGIRLLHRVLDDHFRSFSRTGFQKGGEQKRALIYGMGFQSSMCFRENILNDIEFEDIQYIGLVTDDFPAVGHYVHGLKILGLLSDVPVLVKEHHIDFCFLLQSLTTEQEQGLVKALNGFSVKIIRFDVRQTLLGRSSVDFTHNEAKYKPEGSDGGIKPAK